MVDHFRAEVLAPGMRDYGGSYTFREFERYLYGQLRDVATAADPEAAVGSSAPSSSPSPLDPSFGHSTAAASSGPSSFQTLPPPSTLSKPITTQTPSPTKQPPGRKATVSNLKPAERKILEETPVKLPGEREPLSSKGAVVQPKRVLPRIGGKDDVVESSDNRREDEGHSEGRASMPRRAVGLRPPTKPALPRYLNEEIELNVI